MSEQQVRNVLLILARERARHYGTRPAGEEDILKSKQYLILRRALAEGQTLPSDNETLALFREVCEALGCDLTTMRKVFYGY